MLPSMQTLIHTMHGRLFTTHFVWLGYMVFDRLSVYKVTHLFINVWVCPLYIVRLRRVLDNILSKMDAVGWKPSGVLVLYIFQYLYTINYNLKYYFHITELTSINSLNKFTVEIANKYDHSNCIDALLAVNKICNSIDKN